jgi:hypothetical protein
MVPKTVSTRTAYRVGIKPNITFGDVSYEIFGRLVELYESRSILEIYGSNLGLSGCFSELLGVTEHGMELGIQTMGIVSCRGINYLLFAAVDHSLGVSGKSVTVLDLVYVDFTSNEVSIRGREGFRDERVF